MSELLPPASSNASQPPIDELLRALKDMYDHNLGTQAVCGTTSRSVGRCRSVLLRLTVLLLLIQQCMLATCCMSDTCAEPDSPNRCIAVIATPVLNIMQDALYHPCIVIWECAMFTWARRRNTCKPWAWRMSAMKTELASLTIAKCTCGLSRAVCSTYSQTYVWDPVAKQKSCAWLTWNLILV